MRRGLPWYAGIPAALPVLLSLAACSGEDGAIQAGAWTILDTRTDQADIARAKQNAEDALTRHPGIDCMVGLWSYNGPAILGALQDAEKTGEVAIVAFDEETEVLQGIEDGHIHGTVVQQPFEFGYQSVRLLAGLARGDRSVLPEDGIAEVPVQVVRQPDVPAFRSKLEGLLESAERATGRPRGPDTVELAFITNNTSTFWSYARAGVKKAEADFDAAVEFLSPPTGTADDQKRLVEAVLAKGVQGIAISPNDSKNQVPMLDEIAEQAHLICHDSDAPESARSCFVGTNNYLAGREAGKLIKEALPDGGEVMLFVGRMDAQNAIERRQGILDELAGAPPG